jgi:hypothetical protein
MDILSMNIIFVFLLLCSLTYCESTDESINESKEAPIVVKCVAWVFAGCLNLWLSKKTNNYLWENSAIFGKVFPAGGFERKFEAVVRFFEKHGLHNSHVTFHTRNAACVTLFFFGTHAVYEIITRGYCMLFMRKRKLKVQQNAESFRDEDVFISL